MDEHHRYTYKMPGAEPSIEELLALKEQLAAEKAAAQKLEARLVKKGAKGEERAVCTKSSPLDKAICDVIPFFFVNSMPV